jgi:hypothetical protein
VVRIAIIVASALGILGFGAMLAVALGRAAAIADQESERTHAARCVTPSVAGYRQSYQLLRSASPRHLIEDRQQPRAVGLHETLSVPSMPAWRWPGTEQ